MITKRLMIEFADFVLRRNNAKRRRRGSMIDILVLNKPVATYYVTSRNKIYLHFDVTNLIADRMKELIRFNLAMSYNKAIVINNSQCTQQTCFDNLIDDFRDDWNVFMNHNDHMQSETSVENPKKNDSSMKQEQSHAISSNTANKQPHANRSNISDKINAELFLDVLKRFNNQLDLISM